MTSPLSSTLRATLQLAAILVAHLTQAQQGDYPPPPPVVDGRTVPRSTNSVYPLLEPPDQFTEVSLRPFPKLTRQTKRVRTAQLNADWRGAGSGEFMLNLFDDFNYKASVIRTERMGNARIHYCLLEGKPEARLILAEKSGAVAASVSLKGRTAYTIRPALDGSHHVMEFLAPAPTVEQP